jgi:hypothetical protein
MAASNIGGELYSLLRPVENTFAAFYGIHDIVWIDPLTWLHIRQA